MVLQQIPGLPGIRVDSETGEITDNDKAEHSVTSSYYPPDEKYVGHIGPTRRVTNEIGETIAYNLLKDLSPQRKKDLKDIDITTKDKEYEVKFGSQRLDISRTQLHNMLQSKKDSHYILIYYTLPDKQKPTDIYLEALHDNENIEEYYKNALSLDRIYIFPKSEIDNFWEEGGTKSTKHKSQTFYKRISRQKAKEMFESTAKQKQELGYIGDGHNCPIYIVGDPIFKGVTLID